MVNFSGVETASASRAGNFIKPGNYIVQLVKVEEGTNRKKEEFVVFNMTVLHVFDGEHKLGDTVSHMLMEKQDSFFGNWKAAIMGITGCEEEEITESDSKQIVGDTQPLAKMVVKVNAFNVKTKADKDFTVVEYHGGVNIADLTDEAKSVLID